MQRSTWRHHSVHRPEAPVLGEHASITYLRRCGYLCVLLVLLLAAGHPALAQAIRIVFLHHSCGQNLIEQGNVRQGLAGPGYEFHDHGYNEEGLRLADGSYTGTDFDVPDDNTDPDGFAGIFAQPLHDPPDNAFSHLMQYDVIAFKSCFPVSNVGSDEQLAEYQSHYLAIRDRMDQYPDRIFIVVTQPPQVPANSDPAEAVRARVFVNWLQSGEYLAGHLNVFVFDFFGLLAGDDDFLRPEYRVDEYDGHPNERANRDIGPLFVAFIDEAIRSYEAGGPRPTPTAPTVPPGEATQPSPLIAPTVPPGEATQPSPLIAPTVPPGEATQPSPLIAPPPPVAGLVDGFESAADHWETDTDGSGSTIECGPDTGVAHSGVASLRIHYDVAPEGWGDCGRVFELPQDWSGGTGISLWLHSDEAGEWVTLMLFAGDPAEPTPFEVYFETTPGSAEVWAQFVFSWTDFVRAEWADGGGLAELDLARVTGFGFSVGADDTRNEGTLWVDDVGLVTRVEQPPGPITTPTAVPVSPGGGEWPEGGICPFAAVTLPLGSLGILLASRRRR